VRECLRTGLYTHQQIRDLTLREVSETLDAAAWRRRQSERASIYGAYHVGVFVALAKHGKLEDLDHYLGDEERAEPVELTPAQEELVWKLVTWPTDGSGVH